jgi:two-component system NarL family sensor kinase
MHDDLGQILATVNLAIQRALDRPAPKRREALLSQALESNEIAMARVRELSHLLHPSVLDDLGLKAAVKSFVSEFTEERGIEVESILKFESGDIPSAVKINLYRIVQEALNNVAKHSGARKASVRLFANGHDLKLSVKDNGRGFDFEGRAYKTLGLLGMRERAELSGGTLVVVTAPGRGTEIRVSIPKRRS